MANEIVELEVKSNIGEVTDGIDKATASTKKLDDATQKGAKGFKGIGSAVKGVGMALKAAGIGLVVALLAKLMEVFSKNQKVMDFFNVAMESLSIAFNDLFGFLEKNVGNVTGWFKDIFENPKQSLIDFGTAIKENLIERFNSFLDTVGHLGKAIGHLMDGEFGAAFDSVKAAGKESIDIWTGVDNSVDKLATTMTNAVGAIKDYAKETINSATATIELNKAAELAAVQVQGLIEDYDRQAEKLRQVRDDETKTFAERIEANTRLGEVLKEQGVEMQKLVDIQVNAAQVEFNKNQSQENLIALTEALNERKAVEAQITGFQSEQLTNQVSLEKELGAVKNELMLEGLLGIELELEELRVAYEEKKRLAELSGADMTAITAKYEKEKKDILEAAAKTARELNKAQADAARANVHAQLEAFSGLAGALSSLAGENKELAVGQAIIDTYVGANKAFAQGGTVGFVTAAAVIASGLANVQKILSTPVGDGGGGGGGGGGVAAPPAPEMMSGAFELGGGQAPEPVKAYVVTDEMSDSQDQLANIRRRATI